MANAQLALEFIQGYHRGKMYYQLIERLPNNKIKVLSGWKPTKAAAYANWKPNGIPTTQRNEAFTPHDCHQSS